MGRTHVRMKGKNLNFYLETHAPTHNIYFIRLKIHILAFYTDVCTGHLYFFSRSTAINNMCAEKFMQSIENWR